jgi:Spy/CpxP family protein refolding chaperone
MKLTLAVMAGALLCAASLAHAQPGSAGMHGPSMRWGRSTTPGWSMMSTEERQAHWDKLHSFKSYEDCKACMDAHHEEMNARAKERGASMPDKPMHDPCASLKTAQAKTPAKKK